MLGTNGMNTIFSRILMAVGLSIVSASHAQTPAATLHTESLQAGADDIPPRIERLTPSPGTWIVDNVGLTEIQIGFDERVTVPSSAVSIYSMMGGAYTDFATSYDEPSETLILVLNTPIRDDRVTVVVDYGVADVAGNALDGEFVAPASPSLPSGNGLPGGQAVFQINVLQGDANQDGTVDTADAALVVDALGTCSGEDGYNAIADLNGDGCINALDAGIFSIAEGRTLPADDGNAPSVTRIEADPGVGPFGSVDTIEVGFSEAIDPGRFGTQSVVVTDASGQLLPADMADLAMDGLSATFTFDPALVQCEVYDVALSNALADASGALLITPETPTHIGLVPPQPVLDPHSESTSSATITITGSTQNGATVEVSGPETFLTVPATGSTFSVDVPLESNRDNHLFFTTISVCDGARSAPVSTVITQDSQPPALFIDFPVDGAEITTATTDVAGRVGDTLSGFLGLSVSVNGQTAIVDIGIGTNGTFFIEDVPLIAGESTAVQAIATDQLGNIANKSITVVQQTIPPDAPRIGIVSGNAQSALVNTGLAEPLAVQLTTGDGDPIPDKLVTFKVTRSDGRLTTDGGAGGKMMLQVRTDANGEARAFLTLGSEAGCGNNRVDVTSTSVIGTTVFCASANANAASQINVGMGNQQRGEAGGPVAEPLRVWVSDGRNGVSGVPVTFDVVQGGGAVDGLNSVTVVSETTGHAEVGFVLGLEPGINVVEATILGVAQSARFTAIGSAREENANTRFTGTVLDNSNRAIQGALCVLEIGGVTYPPIQTDIDGRFEFPDIPSAGAAEFHVDGITAFHVGGVEGIDIPLGSYPVLGYELTIVPNIENKLPTPVLLPPLNPANARTFDNTSDLELTVDGIDGMKMIIRAGSMTRADGSIPNPSNPAIVSLNQVHADEIPMPMPDGASPPFAWTFQPAGARFDPPVEIVMPNMTGLPAGAIMYFLSFNHDINSFEIVATGHVTDDGSQLVTDPGSGITDSGWGGFCPPYPNVGTVDGIPIEFFLVPGNPFYEPASMASPFANTNCGASMQSANPTDPVYLFSGEAYETVEDLRIAGRGLDFIWGRKYRSRIGPNTAQGNRWDYSYNLFLRAGEEGNLVVCDGNSREDIYAQQPDGSWIRPGFFRRIEQNPDGSFELMLEDKGEWMFAALDGSPAEGKITQIVDRNSNEMSFQYDGGGRLATVTDTLGRDITVAYNGDGFIESVTDFAGRAVRYEYYQNGDDDGSFGDLQSVRTPTVTGTPTGNDFPDGKTTVYTYSKGFADDALNHNLTSITDPKGQTYVQYVYSATQDPEDLNYDRVVRQTWGDSDDVIDLVYVEQTPTASNNNATIKAIVNDRVGNVKEYFYDERNHQVILREYTGRADPDVPTTETANRPTGKLRSTDPDVYETRYVWNNESLMTRAEHANGNVTRYIYEADLNPGAPIRSRGNLRAKVRLPGSHLPAGDQETIAEFFEYDTEFGGCCGSNFVTKYIDGRGGVITHIYDDSGNRTQTTHRIPSIVENWEYNEFGQVLAHVHPDNGSGHRRRDEFTYFDSGSQRGYLERDVVDVGGFALTSTYEYDLVGNIVRTVDPRGHDTTYVINELDQTVREISREVSDGSGIRYQYDTYYDANDNVVREDVINIDSAGVLQTNTHFTTTYEYEVLNHPTRMTQEVEEGDSIVTEFAYDDNRNRVLDRSGEAVNGNQPTNIVQTAFDERDLVYRVTRAFGDPQQSTVQTDYDANRNAVTIRTGIEDSPRISERTYDGYNRLLSVQDPMGNVTQYTYDANGNVATHQVEGELVDVPGQAGNVRLTDIAYTYDSMDRITLEEHAFFDAATQSSIAVGLSTRETEYSDNSQVLRVTDARGNDLVTTYDTANRMATATDERGNQTTMVYDANSNVVSATEIEKRDDGQPDESITTSYVFDNLDRLIQETDNAANVTQYAFDSRDNMVRRVDAEGNTIEYEYDGLNRLIETRRLLTDTGDGGGSVIGSIVTSQQWDDSSRLMHISDDRGNQTNYTYDPLDRKMSTAYADGTSHGSQFDVHDNAVVGTDANGTSVSTEHDLLNRPISKTITPGAGVSNDTTSESYQYDGLSRLVRAEDNDSVVTRVYDSLSRVTSETLNSATTVTTYDNAGNPTQSAYPSGRTVSRTFDVLNRVVSISDNKMGAIATYDYIGRRRTLSRSYGNNTRMVYGYDGVRRVTNTSHTRDPKGSPTIFDERLYTWDRAFNKTSRTNSTDAQSRSYLYDSVYRMTEANDMPGGVTTYDYDDVGNRTSVIGGDAPGTYLLDAATPSPADQQMNQYTETPLDSRLYDANGNLTSTSALVGGVSISQFTYDYRNQLVEYADLATGERHTYRYDALGRRIERTTDADGTPLVTRYFYEGSRVCEEQDGGGVMQATYVYGRYLDEVLTMRRGGNDYFYHCDDLGNVVRLTDASGNVVEHYEYDDFGQALDGATLQPITSSNVGNPYFFAARRLDAESGLYYLRTRYYEPVTGRYITRDTIGIWGDASNVGNGYVYVGNSPWSYVDPFGQDGLISWVLTGDWNSGVSEWEMLSAGASGFAEGARGGASITANTLTFGGTDYVGLTNSDQYQGGAYEVSRVTSVIARESLITAATLGSAQVARGASISGRYVYIAATPNRVRAAQYISTGLTTYETATGAYDVVAGIKMVSCGDTVGGLTRIAGGSLSLGGAGGAMRERMANQDWLTRRMQSHVDRAAREVDELGMAAFTPRQAATINRRPGMRNTFRGSQVDRRARDSVMNDPALRRFNGRNNRGPDFLEPATGRWWDMTTPGHWDDHLNRGYSGTGTFLDTTRTQR